MKNIPKAQPRNGKVEYKTLKVQALIDNTSESTSKEMVDSNQSSNKIESHSDIMNHRTLFSDQSNRDCDKQMGAQNQLYFQNTQENDLQSVEANQIAKHFMNGNDEENVKYTIGKILVN